jgi:voltage-gated potassium channel Kch
MAVGVISLSMLVTPLLVRLGNWIAKCLEGRCKAADVTGTIPGAPEQRVLIGGHGRVGHTIATLLQASGIPVVAFDTDPERVAQGDSAGHDVLYGDISDPELLAAAHAERATLIVITIDHPETALRAVSFLRDNYPRVPVIVRARDLEATSRLLEAGATQAYPEAIEASLRLGAAALQMLGAPSENIDLLIQGVRDRGYELVQEDGNTRYQGRSGSSKADT